MREDFFLSGFVVSEIVVFCRFVMMSMVDKMFIKGIWVFDLENMCVIMFFRFFMFIVGLNGVGKMVC